MGISGSNKEVLEKFKGLSYEMLVVKKNGKFYAQLPELSMIAEDADAGRAVEKLEILKNDYFEKMLAAGAEDDIPLPQRSRKQDDFIEEIKVFFIKLLIACVLLGATGVFVLADLRDKIASFASSKFAYAMVTSFTNQLERLSEAPDEKFVQERIKIAKGMIRLRVILNDTQNIFGINAPHGGPSA